MPETTANQNNSSDMELDKSEEEKLDVQYQARIQSLMNRATELSDEAAGSSVSNTSSVDDTAGETPPEPTSVQPKDLGPVDSMPTPRSRPSETSDQLQHLRQIASASAQTAIETHAVRRRRQIMTPAYVAIPVGLVALVLSQWIFAGGGAVGIIVLGISSVVLVVAIHSYQALRRLDGTSSPTKEPPKPTTRT